MITRKSLRPAEERVSPLQQAVTSALEDMKAVNVRVLDVRGLTDIADTMIIASGNSDRHVRSIAERVAQKAKAIGCRALGTEGPVTVSGAGGSAGHPGHVMRRGCASSTGSSACGKAVPVLPVAAASHLPAPGAAAAHRALALRDAHARDRRGHAHARLGAQRLR
jgi:ribosome silencing factor RsfS/YbeB/iojap